MNKSDFNEHAPGKVIVFPSGHCAFVPNSLPPKLDLSWELAQTLSAADRYVSELAGIGRTLPNPHLLIRSFIRREAVFSSQIEGTQADIFDMIKAEAIQLDMLDSSDAQAPIKDDTQISDVRETYNYIRALEHGLKRLSSLPISLRLIREIHAQLMSNVRGNQRAPGEFRRVQNYIGPPDCGLTGASYVPPPVDEMKEALNQLERFIHQPSDFPHMVRLALIHYQFEAIHPFLDGNGRVGRLLITLLLCHTQILPQPLLYPSSYFHRHRDEYYRLLLAVSQKGQWHDWIAFFLRGIAVQAQDAVMRTRQLMDLWHEFRNELQTPRSSSLPLQLLDHLFSSPMISVTQCAQVLEVTYHTAQKNINKLIEAGILEEITGQKRNRLYLARRILETIEEEYDDIELGL